MTRAALVMACVSATSAVTGVTILTRRVRSEAAIYGQRIAGVMFCALALILALYAYGLEWMAQP